MHAITLLLHDDGVLAHALSDAERLLGAYEIAESAADELRLAARPNAPAAHRLLLRAHFIQYLGIVGAETACDLLRTLIEEVTPKVKVEGDPTDWDAVALK